MNHKLNLALVLSLLALSGCNRNTPNEDNQPSVDATESASAVAKADSEDGDVIEECIVPDVSGYTDVGCLRDGLAGVIQSTESEYGQVQKVGYIDKEGKVVIPIIYDAILAGEGGEYGTFRDFSEKFVAVTKDGKFGFINTQGNTVIPLKYDWANDFSEGIATVSSENYGAIDKTGKTVIPFEYASLGNFKQGIVSASKYATDPQSHSDKYGFIDKNNKEVIPFIYDNVGTLSEGLIAVQKEDKWGYIDKSNQAIIPITLTYQSVSDFSEGLAAVFDYESADSDNMKFGYINKQGKLVIPMQYQAPYGGVEENTINFSNGTAVVFDKEGNRFCINKKGANVDCADEAITNNGTQDNEQLAEANSNGQAESVALTDYLALQPNKNWSWSELAKVPNIKEWRSKTPSRNEYDPADPTYSINGGIDDATVMMVYGTKAQPNLVIISSEQGVAEDENASGVYSLEDLFTAQELTRIPSNCDKDSMFTQKFYKWQKSGYQPLYVYALEMPGNGGTSNEFGIAKSIKEFFKPEYNNAINNLDASDQESNEVTCTFKDAQRYSTYSQVQLYSTMGLKQ